MDTRKILSKISYFCFMLVMVFILLLFAFSNYVESQERCVFAETVKHLNVKFNKGNCLIKLDNGEEISITNYFKFIKESD